MNLCNIIIMHVWVFWGTLKSQIIYKTANIANRSGQVTSASLMSSGCERLDFKKPEKERRLLPEVGLGDSGCGKDCAVSASSHCGVLTNHVVQKEIQ